MASMIGKPVPLIDSLEKVTGGLKYGSDFKLPGMLLGKVLRSPIPHGRILHIDASKARATLLQVVSAPGFFTAGGCFFGLASGYALIPGGTPTKPGGLF